MSGFDPGERWRQVAENDIRLGDAVISYASEYGADPTWWVREAPAPPLPTEPYTVIRVTWRDGGEAGFTLRQDGSWRGANADLAAVDLADRITGFEVLAEPRAVTVKAVFAAAGGWLSVKQQEEITAEMGVEL